MPMTAPEIEVLLRETFPTPENCLPRDDGVHMAAPIVGRRIRPEKIPWPHKKCPMPR